ncbi:MAG: DNA repair protein RadC [Rhodospirillales bacterium]|nr:DNA repair protein RadC [Rhodospirillales bacterium]
MTDLFDSSSDKATKPKAIPKAKPHYHGHRQRLRQRLLEGGAEAMPDYEILELLLCLAMPQRDMKPLAKALIARFGSFAGVLAAESERLLEVPGLKESGLAALRTVREAARRLAKAELGAQTVIGNWERLIDYCRISQGHDKAERFRILFLDRKNQLIADEVQQKGTIDHTPLYPREVVKRALDLGAAALILVHNHPSGDVTPSKDDVAMTRAVHEAAGKLGIQLHDHVIISKSGATSFKSLGLL